VKTDRTLWCWGANESGQLGDGTTVDKNTPTQVGTGTNWGSVSGGGWHTCGVKTDGTFWCWGWNNYGQLGIGSFGGYFYSPMQIGSFTNWVSVSAGWRHTCGVRNDGTLWCWGRNFHSQLGDGTTVDTNSPTQVPGTNWVFVSAGIDHTCGVSTDRTLWCWGWNIFGQLGDGTTVDKNTPTQVSGTNWASVSTGGNHTCGVKTDGTLWCWGDNFYGQLGIGSVAGVLTPTQVGTATNWVSVSSAGGVHTCGVKTDGTLWCWGRNEFGQLGDGTTVDKNTPTQVGTGTNWGSIFAGFDHTCGIKTDGTLWCWGHNNYGQLGDGTTVDKNTPTQVR
jgi:alpha-tubulin suppressor-like RCC1 family protein